MHYGAILNPVVFSVSMGSFHNHSSCSPGSPCFCAEALCLIPVCKEWGCNTQRCHLGADGRHGCDFSPELKLPREVPRGRTARMQQRLWPTAAGSSALMYSHFHHCLIVSRCVTDPAPQSWKAVLWYAVLSKNQLVWSSAPQQRGTGVAKWLRWGQCLLSVHVS